MAAKKKEKKAHRDMTTEEAIHVLFPKHVVKAIKRALADEPEKEGKKGKKRKRDME